MNKDALLASIIGFAIGLVFTGILILGPSVSKFISSTVGSFSKKISTSTTKNTSTPTTTSTSQTGESFTVLSPLQESIESSAEVVVTGKAPSGSVVVVQTPDSDAAATVGSDNTFAIKFTLSEGKNILTVTNKTKDTSVSKLVTVYYTQESF